MEETRETHTRMKGGHKKTREPHQKTKGNTLEKKGEPNRIRMGSIGTTRGTHRKPMENPVEV